MIEKLQTTLEIQKILKSTNIIKADIAAAIIERGGNVDGVPFEQWGGVIAGLSFDAVTNNNGVENTQYYTWFPHNIFSDNNNITGTFVTKTDGTLRQVEYADFYFGDTDIDVPVILKVLSPRGIVVATIMQVKISGTIFNVVPYTSNELIGWGYIDAPSGLPIVDFNEVEFGIAINMFEQNPNETNIVPQETNPFEQGPQDMLITSIFEVGTGGMVSFQKTYQDHLEYDAPPAYSIFVVQGRVIGEEVSVYLSEHNEPNLAIKWDDMGVNLINPSQINITVAGHGNRWEIVEHAVINNRLFVLIKTEKAPEEINDWMLGSLNIFTKYTKLVDMQLTTLYMDINWQMQPTTHTITTLIGNTRHIGFELYKVPSAGDYYRIVTLKFSTPNSPNSILKLFQSDGLALGDNPEGYGFVELRILLQSSVGQWHNIYLQVENSDGIVEVSSTEEITNMTNIIPEPIDTNK